MFHTHLPLCSKRAAGVKTHELLTIISIAGMSWWKRWWKEREWKKMAGRNWVMGEMGNEEGIRILEREKERMNWEDIKDWLGKQTDERRREGKIVPQCTVSALFIKTEDLRGHFTFDVYPSNIYRRDPYRWALEFWLGVMGYSCVFSAVGCTFSFMHLADAFIQSNLH